MTFPTPGVMFQGGLPIVHQGECVGAIGVSGVQSHEDEQVAQGRRRRAGLKPHRSPFQRHARACPGHPRLARHGSAKDIGWPGQARP